MFVHDEIRGFTRVPSRCGRCSAPLGNVRICGFSGTGEVPPCAPAAVWPVRFSRAALCTARGTASAHSRTAHSPLSYEPPLVRNPPTSPPVVSGPARQTLMAPWPYPSVRAPPGPAHPHGRAGDGHGVASLACTHGRTCTDPHGGACTCPPFIRTSVTPDRWAERAPSVERSCRPILPPRSSCPRSHMPTGRMPTGRLPTTGRMPPHAQGS